MDMRFIDVDQRAFAADHFLIELLKAFEILDAFGRFGFGQNLLGFLP